MIIRRSVRIWDLCCEVSRLRSIEGERPHIEPLLRSLNTERTPNRLEKKHIRVKIFILIY